MKSQLISLALFTSFFSISATAAIIGSVESVTEKSSNKALVVKGWACSEKKNQSLVVILLAKSSVLNSGMADKASEATISTKCKTTATAHRFEIEIPKTSVDKFLKESINVQAAIPGGTSKPIDGSGKFVITASATPTPIVETKPPVTPAPATPTNVKKVIGNIDSVTERASDGAVIVSGWACDKSQNKSINIHIYANGSAGTTGAKNILVAAAGLPSEPAISSLCGTTSIPHRFQAVIPKSTAQTYNKSLIYVHGISASGGSNLLVDNSGKLALTVAEKKVIGNIDSVVERVSDRAVIVSGWACDQSVKTPISVHLYLNGAAGSGNAKFIQAMTTTKASDAAISASCGTAGIAHRFEFVIPKATAVQNSNVPVYVHGMSLSKGSNLTINGSGTLRMPNASQNLYLSDLVKDASGKMLTGDLTIPEGSQVTIDTSIDIKSLIVHGRLVCPVDGDFTLKVSAIHVMGKEALLQCGTSVTPYKGKLKIAIKAGTKLETCEEPLNPCSDRNIMAMNGGTIRLIGDTTKSKWLKIAKTVMPKDSEITLTENVNWSVGDQVSLAPTGFKYNEAEDLIIKSVAGKVVTFTTPIKYRHNGVTSKYEMPNKTWTVDERAEVANLTRNIHITSDGVPSTMDYKGAHMMVMVGSYAYIDGVEFSYMGRMGEMARYPFHWHRVLDGDGQYIKNSSIHHSFQRCVTVHATNNTTVENNVCYDHYGHGFFLEDGNETGNVITGNLGMFSRRPLANRHILQSDIDVSSPERFPGPATFWISNPDNKVSNNVSAGSQGTGFWMSFLARVTCNAVQCGKTSIAPDSTSTLEFNSNTARTNMVGFTWDGVEDGPKTKNPRNPNDRSLQPNHYSPSSTPEIKNMKAYKSLRAAMYTRGRTMIFSNAIMADSRVAFFAAYNTILQNSAIIATTDNHLPEEYNTVPDFTGARIYDGPFDLRDVDFINFQDRSYNGKKITPYAFRSVGASERFGNVVQGIRFLPQPERMILFDNKEEDNVLTVAAAASLTDLDGSITGTPNSVLVPNHAFNKHPSCVTPSDKSDTALICKYRVGFLSFYTSLNNYTGEFNVRRSDGVSVTSKNFFNKVNLIYGGDYDYEVDVNSSILGTFIMFKTGTRRDISPIIVFRGMPKTNCLLSKTLPQLKSLKELRAYNGTAFFSSGTTVYFKGQGKHSAYQYVGPQSHAAIGYGEYGTLSCKN